MTDSQFKLMAWMRLSVVRSNECGAAVDGPFGLIVMLPNTRNHLKAAM